ncbi:MAG: hypothetical protein AAGH89_17900 [Verrucomicrobiota bacterium]
MHKLTSLPECKSDPEDVPNGPYFGAQISWDFKQFEPVLREVAEDSVRAIVISKNDLTAYAPYDGGADLFLPDSDSRDKAKEEFFDFLSERPDGL